jgi:DNA relaxase NicK
MLQKGVKRGLKTVFLQRFCSIKTRLDAVIDDFKAYFTLKSCKIDIDLKFK